MWHRCEPGCRNYCHPLFGLRLMRFSEPAAQPVRRNSLCVTEVHRLTIQGNSFRMFLTIIFHQYHFPASVFLRINPKMKGSSPRCDRGVDQRRSSPMEPGSRIDRWVYNLTVAAYNFSDESLTFARLFEYVCGVILVSSQQFC